MDCPQPFCTILLRWSVPTTPDPNTSATISRYKWKPYRETDWCTYYFLPRGMLFQKHRDRNGRCTAILFKSIGVRGRFDSPDSKVERLII